MHSYDLDRIKDKYGENMMHLCRELFPTLLDRNGLLFETMLSYFYPTHFLYEDLINNSKVSLFQEYILSKIPEENRPIEKLKTAIELLKEIGYDLYECKTQEEVLSFKKYYRLDEELCTFKKRKLADYRIFFAIKENALELNRDDFHTPMREDEYSTSVLCIQFKRGHTNPVSIKSRYNHTVFNPDATLFNNLDNIVTGLTRAFEKTYGLKVFNCYVDEMHMPNYVKAKNGKYYRYNYHINNIYYCPDNIIIVNGNVFNTYMAKERYIIADYFIIDLQEKKISIYDDYISDCFPDCFNDILKIEVYNDKKHDIKCVYIVQEENYVLLFLNKYNQIIAYHNECIDEIGDNFLIYNNVLCEITLPNVRKIGNSFQYYNHSLKKISAPRLKKVGNAFLLPTDDVCYDIPSLKRFGKNKILKKIIQDRRKKNG